MARRIQSATQHAGNRIVRLELRTFRAVDDMTYRPGRYRNLERAREARHVSRDMTARCVIALETNGSPLSMAEHVGPENRRPTRAGQTRSSPARTTIARRGFWGGWNGLVDLTPAERQRLARILGMLGSEHAGERASAALKAEEFRKKHGLTWAEMLAHSRHPGRSHPHGTPLGEAAEAKARAQAEAQRAAKAKEAAEPPARRIVIRERMTRPGTNLGSRPLLA